MALPEAVRVSNLHKRFGAVEALRGVSFTVMEGEIYGLIGPNGAGKTTTIRILSTLLTPTEGSAEVCGHDVAKEPDRIRELVSYLPEDAGAYPYLSGQEYLEFMAGFYAGNRADAARMVETGRDISGLGERLLERVNDYSKGMKRRLLIARALMMRPRVAILDEPTAGLDVIQAIHVREMILNFSRDLGVTVLLSSHNMLEVEFLCGKVALMDKGLIVADGSAGELKAKYGAENLEVAFMEATKVG